MTYRPEITDSDRKTLNRADEWGGVYFGLFITSFFTILPMALEVNALWDFAFAWMLVIPVHYWRANRVARKYDYIRPPAVNRWATLEVNLDGYFNKTMTALWKRAEDDRLTLPASERGDLYQASCEAFELLVRMYENPDAFKKFQLAFLTRIRAMAEYVYSYRQLQASLVYHGIEVKGDSVLSLEEKTRTFKELQEELGK